MSLVLSLVIGGSLGALLGKLGRCSSGACALAATPWRGALLGSVFGLVFYLSSGQKSGVGVAPTPNVRQISSAEFETEVIKSSLPVVVDFYATWCGPCKVLAPKLNEIAGSMAGKVKFVKVDVDRSRELAERYQIQGVPTLLVFQNGRLVDKTVGLPPGNTLRSRLELLVGAPGQQASF